MSVIRHSISEDDKYGKVKSPFLTAINIFKFDSNTRCSLVRYTFGKLLSGVIVLLSMSIPNVFLKMQYYAQSLCSHSLLYYGNKLIQFHFN